ncbi:SDR family oxidoreductase [Nocardiopsis coralliicola]
MEAGAARPAAPGPDGVERHTADLRDPRVAALLEGVDVLVHTAVERGADARHRERRSAAVRAAQTLLTAAAAQRVGRVVLVTSTMVYGAAPDNPVPLPEDGAVVADSGDGLVGDFTEIEELARRARRAHPGLSVTVVRPAPLVGPGPDTVLARHFAAPRLIAVKGVPQRWQFCHVADLASALELVAVQGVDGPGGALAVGSDGALSQAEAEEVSGLRGFEVPAGLAFGATHRLHRAGITPASAGELKFLVYPCVVECATLHRAGWKPAFTNAGALEALLEARTGRTALVGRELGRKEAAISAAGAAGAAVAAIGTAAAVRHIRKRRRT